MVKGSLLCDNSLDSFDANYKNTNKYSLSSSLQSKNQADTLTKHIVSRWYRSPEVILLQQYDYSVDVWSAGCIFAELLGN